MTRKENLHVHDPSHETVNTKVGTKMIPKVQVSQTSSTDFTIQLQIINCQEQCKSNFI
jgi:hypothetical protein